MEGQMELSPQVLQAVKIVLKYEIKALLQRLADTGEESVVLTANVEDGVLGHLGSHTGEQFWRSTAADIQAVKQRFLSFCTTGDQVVGRTDGQERWQSSTSIRHQQHRQSGSSTFSNVVDFSEPQFDCKKDSDIRAPVSEKERKYEGSQRTTHDSQKETHDDNSTLSSQAIKQEVFDDGWWDSTGLTPGGEGGAGRTNAQSEINQSRGNDKQRNSQVDLYTGQAVSADSDLQAQKGRSSAWDSVRSAKPLTNTGLYQTATKNRSYSSAGRKTAHLGQSDKADLDNDQSSVFSTNPPDRFSAEESEAGPGLTVESGNNLQLYQDGQVVMDTEAMKNAFVEIGHGAKCLICNKVLHNKNNRTFHWRSHVGDKRYKCDICGKAFTHPSNMRSHRRVHTGEKPFPCTMCDKRYRRRDHLQAHMEKHLLEPQPLQSDTTWSQTVADSPLQPV